MRPSQARAQHERHGAEHGQIVKAGAHFAARVVRRHGVVGEPEATAAQIGLAVARRAEPLRLQCRVGRGANHGAACRHTP